MLQLTRKENHSKRGIQNIRLDEEGKFVETIGMEIRDLNHNMTSTTILMFEKSGKCLNKIYDHHSN